MTIAYYVTRQRKGRSTWGYWAPCLARRSAKTGKIEPTLMAKLGFELVDCGEDGPAAWSIAEGWNQKWHAALKAYKAGETIAPASELLEPVYPKDSLGEAFARLRGTGEWAKKAKGTQDDWFRGWRPIAPVFGDVDPSTVTFEDFDLFYNGDPNDAKIKGILETLGVRESHRVVKIWRAMWKVVGSMKRADGKFYCDKNQDPSKGIRRTNPKGRTAYWFFDEATVLVDDAWAAGFKGLSAALAVAWDTMLSPVDVRSLTLAQLAQDGAGSLFNVDRAKTGRAAIGTLSEATRARLDAYVASLPFTLHPDMPIFHTRGSSGGAKGGRPQPPALYTKDTLSKDFRDVREISFKGDTRKISDFRRSGAIETVAGDGDLSNLASKMANTIDSNRDLQQTYTPHTAQLVRMADAAREIGRKRMRESKNGSGT